MSTICMGNVKKIGGFKWKNEKSNFYKGSYRAMMKTVTRDTYLKSLLCILRNYKKHTVIYHCYQKE